jgi:hypothetical protein
MLQTRYECFRWGTQTSRLVSELVSTGGAGPSVVLMCELCPLMNFREWECSPQLRYSPLIFYEFTLVGRGT